MIQWFPGHMVKALREIESKAALADFFIVVLDARAPLTTYNREFDKITPHKPRLFVITKADYGDMTKLKTVIKKLTSLTSRAVLVNLKENKAKMQILKVAKELTATKVARDTRKGLTTPRLRAFVIGVPNAGKSTLINLLAGAAKAKVANKPGVTRGQQWINAGEFQLLDTPGVLWPKFSDELIGIKLAVIGSIKIDIIPAAELYQASYKLLSKYYPLELTKLGLNASYDDEVIDNALKYLCLSKNFIAPGNQPDYNKARKWFYVFLRDLKGVTYD